MSDQSATPIAKTPTSAKNGQNNTVNSVACKPENVCSGKRGKRSRLKWEQLNNVTHHLFDPGRFSNTPRSHGKWPAFRTSFPVAWVINIGWAAGQGDAWLGRCRDKRGDWCLGPTSFDDARLQTKNWVLGLPISSTADEWFLTNPVRELNEIQAALLRQK